MYSPRRMTTGRSVLIFVSMSWVLRQAPAWYTHQEPGSSTVLISHWICRRSLTPTLLSTTFSSTLLHSSLLKQFLLCHMSQDILIWKSKFHSDCSSHWSLHYPYQNSDWKPLSSWFSYFRFIWNNKPNHCFKSCWKCTKWHRVHTAMFFIFKIFF